MTGLARATAAVSAALAAFIGEASIAGDFDFETVVADGMWNNRSSVAVGPDGRIHVAYAAQFHTDSSTAEVYYATRAAEPAGPWSFTQITDDDVRQEFPNLVLDSEGVVHIAFHTGVTGGNKIQYVNNAGGAFGPIIDITGAGFIIVKHAVDSEGTVHFAFTTQTAGAPEDVYYRTWSPTEGLGPLVQITDTPTSEEWAPHIAVGPDDAVHLVFQRGGSFGGPLAYLRRDPEAPPTVWTEVDTGFEGTVVDPIVLVSAGNVVSIAYRNCVSCATSALRIIDDGGARSFGAEQVLSPPGEFRPAFYNRFAVGPGGLRYFAFASNINVRGAYFIAETEPGVFTDPIRLESSPDDTHQSTSIDVNADGSLAITYSISGFQDVVFADMFLATTSVAAPCPADLDGDGFVGSSDLGVLLGSWGPCPQKPAPCPADLDGDGFVGSSDLGVLLGSWGPCD